MPNIKSAIKRNRTSQFRRERNRTHRSRMRTVIKKLRMTSDSETAAKILPEAISTIDKNVKFGVLHHKTAARYKSRLNRLVNKLGKSAAE